MKRNYPVLVGILALLLIGAAVLQISVLTYPPYSPEPAQIQAAEYRSIELPVVERLQSPHAILVLDVSGSMKTSDPQRLESEAVRQFYAVYRDLCRETLAKEDHAKVAVILFSTLAQVVDWDGSGNPWLTVDTGNTAVFTSAVERYTGHTELDPRDGSDTDYLAALEEVKTLTAGLPSPPAVLFLTDGKNEPHPLLSPLLPLAARQSLYSTLWHQNEQLLSHVTAGRYRFLRPATGPQAFDRRKAGVPSLHLTPEQEQTAQNAVADSLKGLLQQRFFLSSRQPAVPLSWQPVFLGVEEANEAKDLLLGAPSSEEHGSSGSSFIQCRDPRELPGQFIGALSAWLRLSVRPILRGATRLQVPSDTQAFAVALETANPGTRFELRSASRNVVLAGRNGAWAGVAASGGDWDIETDAGAVQRGQLFLRPRYEWILHAPLRQTISRGEEPIQLDLYLLSLETGKPVNADKVYSKLPEQLPLETIADDGKRRQRSLLLRSPGQTAAYSASVVAPELRLGSLDVLVDLRPLEQSGITVPAPSLSQRTELRANLRVVVTTASGHPASIGMRNVPREATRLRGIWERVHGGRN